ncbi:hypothetical protein GGX14DRAFT_566832 [Mycena pura]|uniref:Uncharacterized protein n=1 Tax=Mycena pura TaxID=153505 RepID=A0AAD6YAL0_9AGAR|nr:hypothetical protein GGX14DRAFT_566832 [Mycena pura]
MVKTKEVFYRQHLAFLGCCSQSHPHYTPLSILLNRSIAHPLVRGESKVIVFARAFVISCVAVGVPAFGIYSIVIVPLNAEVYTKSIVHSTAIGNPDSQALTGNAEIYLEAFDPPGFNPGQINVTVGNEFHCTPVESSTVWFRCPRGWSEINLMSISMVVPSTPNASGIGLFVTVVPWHSEEGYLLGVNTQPVPIVLLSGSHVFGLLTWSARFLKPVGSSPSIYIPEITALQTIPTTHGGSSNIAQLTLRQPSTTPRQYFRDTSDSSALSGVSSLGGFWTFVDGAFVLLFGANIMYFTFGRRPLSALGVVHLFQSSSLSRRWHEDFPALYTEGGLPGSKSAGIVAFIRERLVDVGDDPRTLTDETDSGEAEILHHQLNSQLSFSEESPVLDAQQIQDSDESWQRKEYFSDNSVMEEISL